MLTVLLFCNPAGASFAEQLVQTARYLSAAHTLQQLASLPEPPNLVVLAPQDELDALQQHLPAQFDCEYLPDSHSQPFHFGKYLADAVIALNLERVLYVGAGSSPLLSTTQWTAICQALCSQGPNWAITNNVFSSDWFGCTSAQRLPALASQLPRDNMLGWVWQQQNGCVCQTQPASPAMRLDIDTPADLPPLLWHPETPSLLRRYLEDALPDTFRQRWAVARQVLQTPAQAVALIGRVSPDAWQQLNRQTHCWVRVYAEERGMVASGRTDAGEVRSLIGLQMQQMGLQPFWQQLLAWVQLVFWDNRVYLAQLGCHPKPADRFAADLGLVQDINDPVLRDIVFITAEKPILLGGQALVGGGLLTLLAGLSTQPS